MEHSLFFLLLHYFNALKTRRILMISIEMSNEDILNWTLYNLMGKFSFCDSNFEIGCTNKLCWRKLSNDVELSNYTAHSVESQIRKPSFRFDLYQLFRILIFFRGGASEQFGYTNPFTLLFLIISMISITKIYFPSYFGAQRFIDISDVDHPKEWFQ